MAPTIKPDKGGFEADKSHMMQSSASPARHDNPLLGDWTAPFGTPPFDAIRPEHFRAAFDQALAEHRREVAAIAADAATPSFENTIAALERSGRRLARVSAVFHALAGAHTNDALLEIEREIAPPLAAHWDAIHMNQALFERIRALQPAGEDLSSEQARVLERYAVTFRRAGAGLDSGARQRLAEIGERLAALGTRFSQRVLTDEQAYTLPLAGEDDLAGLPRHVRAAAPSRRSRPYCRHPRLRRARSRRERPFRAGRAAARTAGKARRWTAPA